MTRGQRYLETYFQEYPGIWRHGDFFRIDADRVAALCWVARTRRSTATACASAPPRSTARSALLPEVQDSLIVNLDLPDGGFFMPLFVKLAPGANSTRRSRRRSATRCAASTRRATCRTRSIQVPAIPYTLTGKKMEVPVRRILMGVSPEKAVNRSVAADPGAFDFFIDYFRQQTDYKLAG